MKDLRFLYKFLGDILIKYIITIGLFVVPLTSLAFKFKYPAVPNGWLLFLFMCFLAIERTWETFYSSGDSKKHKLHGDWTLPLVSIAYLIMVFGVIWEFFTKQRATNFAVVLLGFCIFVLSLLLRFYGMRTLKEQWSVHAVGAKKVKNVFLVRSGPYRYIRHPIYLGVILEVLSIPLIWNAYFTFIFACAVSVPLQIMRAYFEERSTIRKLGQDYILYKKTVSAFLPFKLLKPNQE